MSRAGFDTLLIANRGEIAVRIMRTARRMGMRTVAVYSAADRDAPHCRAADLAIPIGASQPEASYLNIAAIIDAAAHSGAQAVHPGYGFLAESAAFAQACAAAGLSFVGPPPGAIQAMGNKAGAKRLMETAGVPCVPGYQGDDQSGARMAAEAARIGYPVMIKAAAGGGGRGMRRVACAEDFAAALRSARSEATNAFGCDELILERAIVEPRHIEIQIFADTHGNVIHLGERDCSVQRRHQKIIEESPSPVITPALRSRMGETAVAAARSIGYAGAGTLEFLLDADGQFYFMEMNTRLQVEHAVTEALVGLDLVEWQLRVALGEALPFAQQAIDERREAGGHAIEVRLCAEDPQQDFLPQSGTVARWRAPREVRVDHALESGLVVSPYYDSMLAKIVAHGSNRADACRRLAHALDECLLLGIKSNRHFLRQCVGHPEFVAGRATTAFIERQFPARARATAAPGPLAWKAAVALVMCERGRRAARAYPAELQAWSNSEPMPQGCRIVLDGETFDARVRALDARRWDLVLGTQGAIVSLVGEAQDRLTFSIDGQFYPVEYARSGERYDFVLEGTEYVAQDTTYAHTPRDSGESSDGRISAPMNGRVVALNVASGDAVTAGQVLMVVEAMKMEHSITAPHAGAVTGLFTEVGAQVAPGRLLLEIEAA